MNAQKKDRYLFCIFAIVLGSIGIQYFYLNRRDRNDVFKGVLCILFSWTAIPAIIGLIVGLIALLGTDEDFAARYGVEVDNVVFGGNPSKPTSNADEIAKYKKLYDDGAITAEEYEKKKRELL